MLQQMLPGLNPCKPFPRSGLGASGFDLYDVRGQTFIPTSTLPNGRLALRLPLRHIPTFKLGHVSLILQAYDRARGAVRLAPTCPMKRCFMHQRYIWPKDLPVPRKYIDAEWTVRNFGMSLGVVATRPGPGEYGYGERRAPYYDWEASEYPEV